MYSKLWFLPVPVSPMITTLISDDELLVVAMICWLCKWRFVLNVVCPSINHSKVESVFCMSFILFKQVNCEESKKRMTDQPMITPSKKRENEKKNRSTEVVSRWIVGTIKEIILWVPWPRWWAWTNIQGHVLLEEKLIENDSAAYVNGKCMKRGKWNIWPSNE